MWTRTFEKWVTVGTAAFALSSSVALKLAISSEHPLRLGSDEPLLSQIRRGAAVTVQLYPDACSDIVLTGQLSCTTAYTGYYNRRKAVWVMTGEVNSPQGHIVTSTGGNAPDEPGNISLLGKPGTFDEAGNLVFHGRVLGTIKTVWQANR